MNTAVSWRGGHNFSFSLQIRSSNPFSSIHRHRGTRGLQPLFSKSFCSLVGLLHTWAMLNKEFRNQQIRWSNLNTYNVVFTRGLIMKSFITLPLRFGDRITHKSSNRIITFSPKCSNVNTRITRWRHIWNQRKILSKRTRSTRWRHTWHQPQAFQI